MTSSSCTCNVILGIAVFNLFFRSRLRAVQLPLISIYNICIHDDPCELFRCASTRLLLIAAVAVLTSAFTFALDAMRTTENQNCHIDHVPYRSVSC